MNHLLSRRLTDPFADLDALRSRGHGMIETRDGKLAAVYLRRLPKVISAIEIELLGHRWHSRRPGDQCLLYYNQPRSLPNYLALKYVVSWRDCTLATFQRALQVLDDIARIKRTDAIVCDVWNDRISDRLLQRWGWEPHLPKRWHRNFIKRFYGTYPEPSVEMRRFASQPAVACW
jgi:hypothetical protein